MIDKSITKETESIKRESREKIGIYVTFNGIPVFSLTNKPSDDDIVLTSSFLHTIDIIARETRKKIEKSKDFFGFAIVDKIEVNVMEVKNMGRLFIETPYGKVPHNKSPIVALLGAARETISKIINKELNPSLQQNKTVNYFKDRLKDRGYTPDKVMTDLGYLQVLKAQFLKYIPISLFSIEQEEKEENKEKIERKYKVEEVGNYNVGKFKNNPVKNEEGELTFDSGLTIGLAEALKSYKSVAKIEKGVIILRFKDYILEVSYKKDGMPIFGVLIKGSGTPEEVFRYRKDIKKLES